LWKGSFLLHQQNRLKNIRVKHLKKKLKETLTSEKDMEELDLLGESSIMA